MEKRKESSVPFWLLEKNYENKDFKFFYLPIIEVLKINFDLDGYWKAGDNVAIVNVDGGRGVIPANEFSITQKLSEKVEGVTRRGYLLDFVSLNYEDGDSETLAIFSTKKYEKELLDGKLEELKSNDSVIAEVISVTDYNVILLWNKLRLTLTSGELIGRKAESSLSLSLFLSVGDKLPVSFKRIKKNGRVIEVTTPLKLKTFTYNKSIDDSDYSPGDLLTGIVVDRDINHVYVKIGYYANSINNDKIILKAYHPHPAIDDLLNPGQVVDVKLKKMNLKQKKSSGVCSIEAVKHYFIDDCVFDFREDLENYLGKEVEESENDD